MYEFSRAEGIYLYDPKGNAYIDLISGIAVNNIGHRHPKVVEAIHDQADKYLHQMVYGEYLIGPQVLLAEKLEGICPEQIQSFYFTNSGSEAVEGAIKLAKKHTGKAGLVAVRDAYHGSSSGALSLMSSEYYSASFKPLLPHVKFIELNNEASLSAIDSDTAAIFIECIQAESGYIPAEPEFLNALQQKARYHNCLIVCDEVQSGLMRTGSMWAFEHGPLKPDVLIMAKGLGGGMPIGCFASSREIMSSLSDDPILGHITTFGGHPVSCAAANACLDVLKEIRGSEILRKEQLFRNGLKHPDIRSISGRGLLLSMELESFERVQKVISAAYRNGLIIDWFLYNLNKLRLAPPLIISDKEILKVCRILNESLELTRT